MIEYPELDGMDKDHRAQFNSEVSFSSSLFGVESLYNNPLGYLCKPCPYTVMLNLKGAKRTVLAALKRN